MDDIDIELETIALRKLEQLLHRNARTIRAWVSRGVFPKPIATGLWRKADVLDWMRQKTAESG